MKGMARSVALVALGVFLALIAMQVWVDGEAMSSSVIWTGVFGALIAGMIYAALTVARILFFGRDE